MLIPLNGVASFKTTRSLEHFIAGAVVLLVGSALFACGFVLVLRRLSGAIVKLPGPAGLLAVCGFGMVLIAVSDAGVRSIFAKQSAAAGTGLWVRILSRVGLVLSLAAVGLPLGGSSPIDPITATLTTLAATAALLWPLANRMRVTINRHIDSPARLSLSRDADLHESIHQSKILAGLIVQSRFQPRTPDDCPGHLEQRLERYQLAGGVDCLRGRLLLAVPLGARTAYGHVGFCPPFVQTPAVTVTTQYDGVEAIVAAAEVLPWGVRVECRLDAPAEEAFEIPIDIFAHLERFKE